MKASKFNAPEFVYWRNYDKGTIYHEYRERDFQRQKAYDAEIEIRKNLINNTKYSDITDVQKRIDKICSYKWFKDRWGNQKISAIYYGNKKHAYGNFHKKYIKIADFAMNDLIVLHELAHAITDPKTGGGHGRYWVATFLELVEKVMGKKDYLILKNSFKKHKVKFNQKRRLSEETKSKMKEHMNNVRQKTLLNT